MTRRIGLVIAGLLALATTAAVFAAPLVYAGISLNGID
jgi:hypothetical protein